MNLSPSIFDVIDAVTEQIKEINFSPNTVIMNYKDYRKVFPYSLIQLIKFQIKRNKRLRHKRK